MKGYYALPISREVCSSGFRIEGVDFSLVEGTFAGIVGPNGSGKTTLFRGCTGDLPLRSGSVVIEGRALSDLSVKERAQKVAIVSQFTEDKYNSSGVRTPGTYSVSIEVPVLRHRRGHR